MTQPKTRSIHQTNKNNKTKPENLMKKEYLESYEELRNPLRKIKSRGKNLDDMEQIIT